MHGQHGQPTPISMGQGCMRVEVCVPCHLRFWQKERPGSFTCHCGNRVKHTPNKSQHRKLTLEGKKKSPAGTRTRNLWNTDPALCRRAIPALSAVGWTLEPSY